MSKICRLAYIKEGRPKECGGEILETGLVHTTFNTPTGDRLIPPVFFYKYCKKCGAVSYMLYTDGC